MSDINHKALHVLGRAEAYEKLVEELIEAAATGHKFTIGKASLREFILELLDVFFVFRRVFRILDVAELFRCGIYKEHKIRAEKKLQDAINKKLFVEERKDMKKLTIYIPDDSLAYIDGDEVRADGIGSTELFGALKAAMLQAEIVLKIKIEAEVAGK